MALSTGIDKNIVFVSLEQATRCIISCFAANQPVAVWGEPGSGKSSVVADIARQLGWKLYDIRSSDKEPSDFGVPYPNGDVVKWLMTNLLPFEELVGDEKCILLLDEIDRADMSVQNMELQLILDRALNGHKLSPNCRIIACGNAQSDIGTTPLSRAAATRMCHIYVDMDSRAARAGWDKWAGDNGVTETMRAYVKQHPRRKEEKQVPLEEIAYRNDRSIVAADKLFRQVLDASFRSDDILLPLIAGCVGRSEANSFIAFQRTQRELPSMQEIINNPAKAKIPPDPDMMVALTEQIVNHFKQSDMPTAKNRDLGPVLQYATRFNPEVLSCFEAGMRRSVPNIQSVSAWTKWQQRRRDEADQLSLTEKTDYDRDMTVTASDGSIKSYEAKIHAAQELLQRDLSDAERQQLMAAEKAANSMLAQRENFLSHSIKGSGWRDQNEKGE